LISKEPIVHNITLGCNHSFEYEYLYYEIIEQKKRHSSYFKCPYCRSLYFLNIPYYEINNIEKIPHINYNPKRTLPILRCQWVIKNSPCNKPAFKYNNGNYCCFHEIKSNEEKCKAICLNGKKCSSNSKKDGYCGKHLKII